MYVLVFLGGGFVFVHPVMDFPEFDAFILIVNCVLSPPRKHLFFHKDPSTAGGIHPF